jgi:hypothetical protein
MLGKCEKPRFKKSEVDEPEFWNSGILDFRISGTLDFRIFWISGFSGARDFPNSF